MAKAALTITITKKVIITVTSIITQNNCNINFNINIVIIHCRHALKKRLRQWSWAKSNVSRSKKQFSEFEQFFKKWIGLKGWHPPSLHLSTRNRADWHWCSIEDWLLRKRSSDKRIAGMPGMVGMGKWYRILSILSNEYSRLAFSNPTISVGLKRVLFSKQHYHIHVQNHYVWAPGWIAHLFRHQRLPQLPEFKTSKTSLLPASLEFTFENV